MNQQDVTKGLAKLTPSSTVIVDIATPAGQSSKFKSVFIGFLPQRFILLQMPDLNKNPQLLMQIENSSNCTVRGLVEDLEGVVIAFKSQIKSITTLPGRMLVMAIPEVVAMQHLRKVTRINTNIDVKTLIGTQKWQGKIINLSAQGCLLIINQAQTSTVEAGTKLILDIIDEQHSSTANINGTVCNIKKKADALHLGLQFEQVSLKAAASLLQQVLFVE